MNNILQEGDIIFINDKFYHVQIVGSEKVFAWNVKFGLFEGTNGCCSYTYEKNNEDTAFYKDLNSYATKINSYQDKVILIGKKDLKGCSPTYWDFSSFRFHKKLEKYQPIILNNLFFKESAPEIKKVTKKKKVGNRKSRT